jgi:Ca2+-transporting ATPase
MITGDYPVTAQNIAGQIGLSNPDEMITGAELEAMDDDELSLRVRTVNVFARMVPEQKLRLVEALKRNGEVVAMTGDGVNDAPALKSAHIGVAMGGRGTDVARESASLVLLDDDFGSIVQAIRMGRRIFDNLKKAMMYIFSVHIPIAGMSLLPVILQWPLALFPVHIVFLELIIDPACSVVFEAERESHDLMRRPPRKLQDPLFGIRSILPSFMQGVGVLCVVFAVFAWGYGRWGEDVARAVAFVTLVLANLGLIFTNRSWPHPLLRTFRVRNVPLRWIVGGAVAVLLAALFIPGLNTLFGFGRVTAVHLSVSLAAALVSVMISELLKMGPFRRLLRTPGRKEIHGSDPERTE